MPAAMGVRSYMMFAVLAAILLLDFVNADMSFGERFRAPKLQRAAALAADQDKLEARQANTTVDSTAGYRYLNAATKPYRVKSLPLVKQNVGEMYSGLVPIDSNDTSRELFFVFEPTIGAPVDEITIWLNGGPGCSSLEGFFQENGRFTWQPGTYRPVENEYSWVNLTNMLWVEQPVGTGFSIGIVTASGVDAQQEIAQDFINFFKNWQDLFGIKNYKIFVTGESYAGRYVPYISAAMLDANNTEYYDLQGALAYDPCIGDCDHVQIEIATMPVVNSNLNLFNFNSTFLADLNEADAACGYASYRAQYLTFPPSGVQPPSGKDTQACNLREQVSLASFDPNPCFNPYDISQMCPILWDVLGFPGALEYDPVGWTNYFDRADVKAAMHAPSIQWAECASQPVFKNGNDNSPDSIISVLPQVIEATNRVLIANGDFDIVVPTQGTLLAIQNMTWNGKLGFQSEPNTPYNVPLTDLQYTATFDANGYIGGDGPQGIMGIQHYERGLQWVEVYQSGHMQPQFQPRSSYRHLQWVLGRIDSL